MSRVVALLLLLAACGRAEPARRAPGAATTDATAAAADTLPAPADSLAAAGRGAELWFTLARTGRDSAGVACIERGVELRRDGRRIPVPLLYTGETPRVVDDSTALVHLWTDCRPGPLYRIDLKTGRPTPAPRAARGARAGAAR